VFGLVVGRFYVFVNLKLAIVGETKVVLSSLLESE
jgi:hypothetical protein